MKSEININQKHIMRELRERLGGKCSYDSNTCPQVIACDLFNLQLSKKYNYNIEDSDYWACDQCERHFHWINCVDFHLKCPCDRNPNTEEILLRIDELIEG